MARPKIIEDSDAIKLIDFFFKEECKENSALLKPGKIVEYIKSHGYPRYNYSTYSTAKKVTDYVKNLKKTDIDTDINTVISFQTVNAAAMVDSNRSRDSLIKAITERDNYYSGISKSAARIVSRYNVLEQKFNVLKKEFDELKQSFALQTEQLETLKKEKRELKRDYQAMKDVLDTYVYPEIANELLVKDGDKRKSHSQIVMKEAVDEHTIDPKTKILDNKQETKSDSNVIKGLFSDLED
ncbi:MAG: hypothetical protein K6G03_00190 [Lachnospiraceae bacterium]|nr:hypothetical protein [Lachnospiraceae bacterium]